MEDRDSIAEGNLGLAEDGIPRLLAYRSGRTTVVIWCRHCQRWHTHGSAVGGHRVAHCAWKSPYMENGYYLILTDRPKPKMPQRRSGVRTDPVKWNKQMLTRALSDPKYGQRVILEAMAYLGQHGHLVLIRERPFYFDAIKERHVFLMPHFGPAQGKMYFGLLHACSWAAFVKDTFGVGSMSILGRGLQSALARRARDTLVNKS